jgi:hypothetical protein
MGEQNRRAVEGEEPGRAPKKAGTAQQPPEPGASKSLGIEADERQTERQAPGGAEPGESAESDSVG